LSCTERTARAFCACSLPKPQWTHWAHLRVGLWHLLNHEPGEALDLLRARIRALNESHGVANTETGGYHETITRFYVWQIGVHIDRFDRSTSIDRLAEQLILRYGAKDLPFVYWSKPRLMSAEARTGWVEPNFKLLTGPRAAIVEVARASSMPSALRTASV